MESESSFEPLPETAVASASTNMPRVNGLEVLKQMKADKKLRMLPVIMLTNSIRSKDLLDAYANHANGFIQKNCDLDLFYQDIDRVLQYWSQIIVLPNAA